MKISKFVVANIFVLIVSGLFHLSLVAIFDSPWEGPISPRKPGLFGVSSGLTVWSIAWVLTKLNPKPNDKILADVFASSLSIEVLLITLQYWRGVGSHFNHSTPVDMSIEFVMLSLILMATVIIGRLAQRSWSIPSMSSASILAIQSGLWLLFVSCLLGFATMIGGEINIAQGRLPETWGPAGVLKYPHGAVLHAIQSLPILAWILNRLNARHASWLIGSTVTAHLLFLAHALWQTGLGRSRLSVDLVGGVLLFSAGCLMIPVLWEITTRLIGLAQGTPVTTIQNAMDK